ncbi:MAG: hypothetical protein LBQ66_11340 [Planctomycetaceae bacterium]|nr:hypothetical protein [Planctomycetaceae bacterium]
MPFGSSITACVVYAGADIAAASPALFGVQFLPDWFLVGCRYAESWKSSVITEIWYWYII